MNNELYYLQQDLETYVKSYYFDSTMSYESYAKHREVLRAVYGHERVNNIIKGILAEYAKYNSRKFALIF